MFTKINYTVHLRSALDMFKSSLEFGISAYFDGDIFKVTYCIDLPGLENAGFVVRTSSIQLHVGEIVALTPKIEAVSSLMIPRYSSQVGSIFFNATKI